MDYHLAVTLFVLFFAIVLFVSNRLGSDLVGLLIIVSLGLSGVLTPQEAFAGFGSFAIITLISIYILAEGLKNTGITNQVADLFLKLARNTQGGLVIITMTAAALLSLFMNNIAAAAILMPGCTEAARKSGVSPAKVLMPLAFATLLGGMATLFTTTNVIASSILKERGIVEFGVLDFLPLGIPIVFLGIIYMYFWGQKLLPNASALEQMKTQRQASADLIQLYHLNNKIFRAAVPVGSSLINKNLAQSTLREKFNLNLLGVERAAELNLDLTANFVLQVDDIMLLEGDLEEFRKKDCEPYLKILENKSWAEADLQTHDIIITESVLSPRSSFIGKTLRQIDFRAKYEMAVLAIWRHGQEITHSLAQIPLQFGDALLLQGPRRKLALLQSDQDLIDLSESQSKHLVADSSKSKLAIFIFVVALIFSMFFPKLLSEILLLAAIVFVLCKIIRMEQAYAAIDWRTVFVVAGILPLSQALFKSGAVELLSNNLMLMTASLSLGNYYFFILIFLLTVVLTQLMNGAAVVSIITPLAIQTATSLGMNPKTMVMGVTLAASMAFLTPLGHAVNLLVMGPGGYSFKDYFKVGLPLIIIVSLLIIFLLPYFWAL